VCVCVDVSVDVCVGTALPSPAMRPPHTMVMILKSPFDPGCKTSQLPPLTSALCMCVCVLGRSGPTFTCDEPSHLWPGGHGFQQLPAQRAGARAHERPEGRRAVVSI